MPSGSPPRATPPRAALAGSAACFGHLAVLRFVVGIALCRAAFRIRPKLYAPHGCGVLISRGITGGLSA